MTASDSKERLESAKQLPSPQEITRSRQAFGHMRFFWGNHEKPNCKASPISPKNLLDFAQNLLGRRCLGDEPNWLTKILERMLTPESKII